jgi:hypothetical protein
VTDRTAEGESRAPTLGSIPEPSDRTDKEVNVMKENEIAEAAREYLSRLGHKKFADRIAGGHSMDCATEDGKRCTCGHHRLLRAWMIVIDQDRLAMALQDKRGLDELRPKAVTT